MTKLKYGRHSSSLKAHRQAIKRKLKNSRIKSHIKTIAKKVESSVAKGDIETARKLYIEAIKKIDKASTKRNIPKNQASRKKSHLTHLVNTTK